MAPTGLSVVRLTHSTTLLPSGSKNGGSMMTHVCAPTMSVVMLSRPFTDEQWMCVSSGVSLRCARTPLTADGFDGGMASCGEVARPVDELEERV